MGNRLARLVRATDEEAEWLRGYLSFNDAKARFRPGNRGRVQLLHPLTETFPAGFVSMIQKAAKAEGKTVDVVDKRVPPGTLDPTADLSWLRDYQREAVDRVLEKKRGILWIPTGGGKTEIPVALARLVPDTHWLFLVHRTSLGEQAAERFAERNALHGVDLGEPGVIGEGRWREGKTFTAATFQTFSAALKHEDPRAKALLGRTGGLFVDECHVLPADSFNRVAMACDAYYRAGLSGTPLARGDQKSIMAIAALGPVILRIPATRLVDAGILSKPRVRLVTVQQPTSASVTWTGVYHDKVVRSKKRNDALVAIAQRAAKPSFLFVKEIAHGRSITADLGRAGLNADFTFGNHSTEYRRSMAKALVRGALDVLVCSVVFQEGIDVPELRSVINGGGSKSIIATLQRLGRGMRVDRAPDGSVREGGDVFEMWDIFDVGNDWLEKHAKARRNAYIQEGHETIVEP